MTLLVTQTINRPNYIFFKNKMEKKGGGKNGDLKNMKPPLFLIDIIQFSRLDVQSLVDKTRRK